MVDWTTWNSDHVIDPRAGLPHGATVTTPATEFGVVLRRLREAHGSSQTALARRARIDRSFVSRLESGTRLPDRETALALAGALGATDEERDALLSAAGFARLDPMTAFADLPLVADVFTLLTDETVPAGVRESAGNAIAQIVALARGGGE